MAVIDPEGLFGGDRLRRCSNLAQLHWPRFYLASDGFGRLEINYARIVGRAYPSFDPIPPAEEIHGYIQEYSDNWLLFLYSANGQEWGQWDTRLELLPRYKTSQDRRSPIPPEKEYALWKSSYRLQTKVFKKSFGNFTAKLLKPDDVCQDINTLRPQSLEVLAEDYTKQTISETFQRGAHGVGIGVGVGIGIGVEKTNTQPRAKTARSVGGDPAFETWFEEAFWPEYWRSTNKAAGKKALAKHATTDESRARILASMLAQKPGYERRDTEKRPYLSTWANQERFNDEPELFENGHGSDTRTDREMQAFDERMKPYAEQRIAEDYDRRLETGNRKP